MLAARGELDDFIESATYLTTLLDFSEPGDIEGLSGREHLPDAVQQFGPDGTGGMMKGSELAQSFASLRANDLIWNYVVNNYLKGRIRRPLTCCSGTAIRPICRGRCTCTTSAISISTTSSPSTVASTCSGEDVDLALVDVPTLCLLLAGRPHRAVEERLCFSRSCGAVMLSL